MGVTSSLMFAVTILRLHTSRNDVYDINASSFGSNGVKKNDENSVQESNMCMSLCDESKPAGDIERSHYSVTSPT